MTTTRLLLVVLALALPGALFSGCGSGGGEASGTATPAASDAAPASALPGAPGLISPISGGAFDFADIGWRV